VLDLALEDIGRRMSWAEQAINEAKEVGLESLHHKFRN
jgi:hypothetical protein